MNSKGNAHSASGVDQDYEYGCPSLGDRCAGGTAECSVVSVEGGAHCFI